MKYLKKNVKKSRCITQTGSSNQPQNGRFSNEMPEDECRSEVRGNLRLKKTCQGQSLRSNDRGHRVATVTHYSNTPQCYGPQFPRATIVAQ